MRYPSLECLEFEPFSDFGIGTWRLGSVVQAVRRIVLAAAVPAHEVSWD